MPASPIDVYSWPTPNGHKIHIMLEECGLPYRAHPVNIGKGDQFAPDFLQISPNNKIPAITDPDGPDGKPISLFESGAILVYLAGKTGKFLPNGDRERYEVLQWLMFQIEVVERQKRIQVQEQEVLRKEKELEATVKKPAEAERHRIQTLANAKKFQTLTEAEGQAAANRSIGEGEADANKARGLAQAEVIRQQGFSEAEAMEKKALAWQMYNQAAIIQQIIEALPQVAAAVAQPLAQTDRIVVINSGGDGAGASKVTQDITNIVAQVPATIEALTGIDLMATLQNLPGLGTETQGSDDKSESNT